MVRAVVLWAAEAENQAGWLALPFAGFLLMGIVGLVRLRDSQRLLIWLNSMNPLATRHRNWRSHTRVVCTVVLVGWCVLGAFGVIAALTA